MATVTKGKTFISGETVEVADLHSLVDSATVSNIVNGDIHASAAIDLTKLSAQAQQSFVPAGAIMPFAMNSAPSGWLAANGAAVSRTTYSSLFSAIGTTHGSGDGSTTFNLPDLRGIFVRGSDTQTISGSSYSGTFASKQKDSVIDHRHTYNLGTSVSITASGGSAAQSQNPTGTSNNTSLVNSPDGGGTETRPANIALLYCIKF